MNQKDKRGLSEVVTTLLIVLLSIVLIAIIWVVIRGLVNQGSAQIDLTTKCSSIDLKAVSVNETSAGVYAISLSRTAGGQTYGPVGVKITVFNSTANTQVLDFNQTINSLETKTSTLTTSVTSGNRIEFTPYFTDASGNEQPCPQTGSFTFKST